jgi:ribosomal protein S18 acetylase RimI-like enzyme
MAGVSEAAGTVSCELLDWDSEHFGFPIARVREERLTARGAGEVDAWCRERGVRCLYLATDAEDAETARVAGGHGFRVVDTRLVVRRSLEGIDTLPAGGPESFEMREATEADLPYLRDLAGRSHRVTRFYFDEGFPRERCDALYETWVERGHRDPERGLLVPLVDGEPAGYMVLAPLGRDRESHGELVAVDERHRGKGVGHALHVEAYRLLASRGARTHRGVHNVRSLAAIRLHERLGFRTEEVAVWHHKWYGEPSAG